MKKKRLIILIISVLLGISLSYYFVTCISNQKPSAQLLEDSNYIKNYILENEKEDDNVKPFIAIKEISIIDKGKKKEFYAFVVIESYNIEGQLLEHNKSITKLYKLVLKNGKIISSDNLNVNTVDSYNNYSNFPEEIIIKYLQMKDTVDLTESIKMQIDNFCNENGKKLNR